MHGLRYIKLMNDRAVRTHAEERELATLIAETHNDDEMYPYPVISDDALAFDDEYTLFSELETEQVSELNRAGFDDCTPVDTFMDSNGDNIYVTEL